MTHKKTADKLIVSLFEILHDSSHDLGVDPGLIQEQLTRCLVLDYDAMRGMEDVNTLF